MKPRTRPPMYSRSAELSRVYQAGGVSFATRSVRFSPALVIPRSIATAKNSRYAAARARGPSLRRHAEQRRAGEQQAGRAPEQRRTEAQEEVGRRVGIGDLQPRRQRVRAVPR